MIVNVENILDTIKSIRITKAAMDEKSIVSIIADRLVLKGYMVGREVTLEPGCRVDLVVHPGIAIEVKKGKPNTRNVEKQIRRYAACDSVKVVILVSERGLIHHITEAYGKPIRYVALVHNWGLVV